MNWHPDTEIFPIIDGAEYDELERSIIEMGGNAVPIVFRMVGSTKQGLDGRHRWGICQKHGLPCKEVCGQLPDEKVLPFILACNYHRRHMTKEQRRELVNALRQRGMSEREISRSTGLPKTTVHNDVRGGGPNGPPDTSATDDSDLKNTSPESVIGEDGKTYPATKPERLLCAGCKKREKPVVGCQECRELRLGKPREPGDESRRGPRPRKNGQELYDWKGMDGDFGRVARIPEGICAAYGHHERQSAEYREAREGLEVFIRAVSRWKKRLTAVDVRIVSA